MSLAELGSHEQEFERTPPHDMAAEQGVLGGMLLSQDAIAEVIETLRTTDFYRPAHQVIYDAILDLYGRGDPADALTIVGELTKRGEINRVGGAPYLHTLINMVPTAANAGYYAKIVQERSVLRKLVEVGTRIAQRGYAADGSDADAILDWAEGQVLAIAEKRAGEDYSPLSDIMPGALDEIEAIGSRGGQMTGVPTGFADLDALTNGLHPGQMIIIAARPAIGKCVWAQTIIVDAVSGERMRIDEFVRRGLAGEALAVHTLSEDWTLQVVRPSDFIDNGRLPVLRLTTVAGRTITTTPSHPFLTRRGWLPLEDFKPGEEIAVPAALKTGSGVCWDEMASIVDAGIEQVYDLTVDGTHNFVANDIIVHNSTLALDLARTASIKHGLTSAFFSLEMGRNEITMRLLSAEAKVALHAMRSGTMTDEDWTRLARRMSEVAEAPLFIDDSPNMSMMEIRAKCRRLKQQHDLRLVVIDYLQLMSSGKRVESRQVEVSEFSRSLKLLAKELKVPVIALSQLNRGPEQRTDKKPMVSDLRESGCVTASARVMRADTNEEVTIGELFSSGARDIPVWALDERLKYVPRTMTHAFSSGRRETYRLRLASGKEIEATGNHPFLTYEGWTPLAELTAGSRIAAPRHVPPPLDLVAMDEDELVVLAHMIGDGSFVRRQPIRYASQDEECLSAVAESAARRFGITAVRDEYAVARATTLRLPAPYRLTHDKRNPIAQWLDGFGLFGLRSHEKFVPAPVFRLPKEQVALFLRHLWATDGCVFWDEKNGLCRL
ncbi:MAG TPA: replicative DNA helicase, partial [Streptosporangiaceae bacterium]|nr:replicative DNA helicase [Streptosporangiaceae bacterium]